MEHWQHELQYQACINRHKKFSDTIEALYNHVNPEINKMCSVVSEEVYNVVMENKHRLDGEIIFSRDFEYN